MAKILSDEEALLSYYDYLAEHWITPTHDQSYRVRVRHSEGEAGYHEGT